MEIRKAINNIFSLVNNSKVPWIVLGGALLAAAVAMFSVYGGAMNQKIATVGFMQSEAQGLSPTLTLTTPAPGSVWKSGTSNLVRWRSTDVSPLALIRISLFANDYIPGFNGLTVDSLNDGSERVYVPKTVPNGNYRVEIKIVGDWWIVSSAGPITITNK